MKIKNTVDLIHPEKFRAKILLIAPPGGGKTSFIGSAADLVGADKVGIATVETGDGKGLLSIAAKGIDYVEPETYGDVESICKGTIFKDKEVIGLDSATFLANTIIKNDALALPHTSGDAPRRARGVPDQGDYGVMAVRFGALMQQLINLDKHIIVTALLHVTPPDPTQGRGTAMITPELPGQMRLGAPAMFDLVLIGRSRDKIIEEGGKKIRTSERYWITEPDSLHVVAKCRPPKLQGGSLLNPTEVYDLATGEGTFPDLFKKMQKAYTEIYEKIKSKGEGQ